LFWKGGFKGVGNAHHFFIFYLSFSFFSYFLIFLIFLISHLHLLLILLLLHHLLVVVEFYTWLNAEHFAFWKLMAVCCFIDLTIISQ